MLKGFRDFLLRGNVVDLAVAVIIGAAFSAVVNSLVTNFLTPLIALIGGTVAVLSRQRILPWGAPSLRTFGGASAAEAELDGASGRNTAADGTIEPAPAGPTATVPPPATDATVWATSRIAGRRRRPIRRRSRAPRENGTGATATIPAQSRRAP